jgi:hypothetical protein
VITIIRDGNHRDVNYITQETEWWWLAVNGASVAASFVPFKTPPTVSPVPVFMIGFRTFEEQHKIQQFLLAAPIIDIEQFMGQLPSRIDAGEIAYVRLENPEPPTRGQTMWVSE